MAHVPYKKGVSTMQATDGGDSGHMAASLGGTTVQEGKLFLTNTGQISHSREEESGQLSAVVM